MNRRRRSQIIAIVDALECFQPIPGAATLDGFADQVDAIRQAELDAFDNLPEAIQTSDKGEVMENAIEALQTVSRELRCFRPGTDSLQAIADDLAAVAAP